MTDINLSTSKKIIKVRGLPVRPTSSDPLTHEINVDEINEEQNVTHEVEVT